MSSKPYEHYSVQEESNNKENISDSCGLDTIKEASSQQYQPSEVEEEQLNPFKYSNAKNTAISVEKVSHFLNMLKEYEKRKEDHLNDYKRNANEKLLSNLMPIPKIDQNSKKIALALNRTFEDRVLHQKNTNISRNSESPAFLTYKKATGAPNCFYPKNKKKPISFENKEFTLNTNTLAISQEKVKKEILKGMKEISTSENICKTDFMNLLSYLHYIPQSYANTPNIHKVEDLWDIIFDGRQTISANEMVTQMEIILSGNFIGKENQTTNIINDIYRNLQINRLLYKAEPKELTTKEEAKPTISSVSKRLAETFRERYKHKHNVKKIDLYSMYKIEATSRSNRIIQQRVANQAKLNLSCTFKPKITPSCSLTPSNTNSANNSMIMKTITLYNMAKTSKRGSGITTNDLEYQKSKSEFTFNPLVFHNHYKTNMNVEKVSGCSQAIKRIKKATMERDEKARNIELRPREKTEFKVSSTPCIVVSLNIGKENEQLLISDSDNPSTIAKTIAKKYSKALIRTGHSRRR